MTTVHAYIAMIEVLAESVNINVIGGFFLDLDVPTVSDALESTPPLDGTVGLRSQHRPIVAHTVVDRMLKDEAGNTSAPSPFEKQANVIPYR